MRCGHQVGVHTWMKCLKSDAPYVAQTDSWAPVGTHKLCSYVHAQSYAQFIDIDFVQPRTTSCCVCQQYGRMIDPHVMLMTLRSVQLTWMVARSSIGNTHMGFPATRSRLCEAIDVPFADAVSVVLLNNFGFPSSYTSLQIFVFVNRRMLARRQLDANTS